MNEFILIFRHQDGQKAASPEHLPVATDFRLS
jgi:hypothetical protein